MLSLFHRALKWIVAGAILVVAAGLAAPYIRADFFRNRVHRALELSLGRKVEIGRVHYNVFTGPGFTVGDVLIHEDPRIGVEPFAHVPEMSITVSPWSLFTGSLRFSSLRLVEPSMNLARSGDNAWNVQLMIDRGDSIELPEIQIRDGRINFKSGTRKNIVYFGNVDADVNAAPGRVRFNLSGEPFRTDRAAVHVGVWGLRGTWNGQGQENRFDGELEIERTGMAELIKLIDGRDPGLRGFVASDARVSGPISDLKIQGKLRLDDLSERLFRPGLGLNSLAFSGTLDVPGQKIALTSGDAAQVPVVVQLDASRIFGDVEWNSRVSFRDLEAPVLADVARQIGVELPQGFAVNGKLRGDVQFSRTTGVTGEITASDAQVRVRDGPPLTGRTMSFHLTGPAVDLRVRTEDPKPPVNAVAGAAPGPAPGQLQGRYDLAAGVMEVDWSERNGSVEELRKLAPDVPLVHQFEQGAWRGSLRWRRTGRAVQPAATATSMSGPRDNWQGQVELTDATVRLTGLADPAVVSLTATLDGQRAFVRNLRGKAGGIAFAGDYRYEPGAPRPHRMNLIIERAELGELERLLEPSLARGRGGILGRLPFGNASEPEWLAERLVEGTVRIGTLTAADSVLHSVAATLQWNGATAKLTDLSASWNDAAVQGDIEVDLSKRRPRYSAAGTITGLAYREGQLSIDGTFQSEGIGLQILKSMRASGGISGSGLQFANEAEFESAEGEFDLSMNGATPQVKLTSLKVQQGADSLTGQGSTQPDGKLLLELTGIRRQIRMVTSLIPEADHPAATPVPGPATKASPRVPAKPADAKPIAYLFPRDRTPMPRKVSSEAGVPTALASADKDTPVICCIE